IRANVTELSGTFEYCSALTDVTLPAGLETIGGAMFDGCVSLKQIEIPSGVKVIGIQAFFGAGLTSVTLPAGLKTIQSGAFYGTALTGITLPASVTDFATGAFNNCGSLTRIDCAAGNTAFSSSDGVLYNKNGTVLLTVPAGRSGAFEVPSGVTEIGAGAFQYCEKLTSVTLPDGLTKIGHCAFGHCTGLAKITIPASVTEIGNEIFDYCRLTAYCMMPESMFYTGILTESYYHTSRITAVWDCDLSAPAVSAAVSEAGISAAVTWTTDKNCEVWQIYRHDGSSWKFLAEAGRTDRSYIDGSVESGKTYRYRVRASIPGRVGTFGTSGSVTLNASTPAPSVTVANGPSGLTVSWNAIGGAQLYSVYRRTGGGSWTALGAVTANSYVDKNVTPGTLYDYRVRTESENMVGPFSKVVTYMRLLQPTGISVKTNDGSITVKWTAPVGATSYEIRRQENNGTEELVATVTDTSFTDTDIGEGLPIYRYWIVAKSGSYRSDRSACSCRYLPVPSLTVRAAALQIELSWSSVSDGPTAVKYILYRSTNNVNWTKLGTFSALSYSDTAVESGTRYYYQVQAKVSGSASAHSASVEALWLDAPELAAINAVAGVKLSWEAIPGATRYDVWRGEGTGALVKIGYSTTTAYTDKTAVSGTVYRYALKARDGSVFSKQSAAVTTRYLSAPVMEIKAYASGIKTTWETVPGATLYNVYRSTAGGAYAKIGTSRTLGYVDRTVVSGTRYSYFVTAQFSKNVSSHRPAVSAVAR
ncbi:MAG: leucine-rich repeat protein, partial [Oscillospiraceae bacterium]|nr:leucine-rich repeat protein [Oscillospiraceae bacterium]